MQNYTTNTYPSRPPPSLKFGLLMHQEGLAEFITPIISEKRVCFNSAVTIMNTKVSILGLATLLTVYFCNDVTIEKLKSLISLGTNGPPTHEYHNCFHKRSNQPPPPPHPIIPLCINIILEIRN